MRRNIPALIALVIIGLILQTVVLLVSTLLPLVADLSIQDGELTVEFIQESIMGVLTSPIEQATLLIQERNPLFIGGTVAVIGFILFCLLKNPEKEKPWTPESKHQTYGSARFAARQEVFKKKRLKPVSRNQLVEDFKKSLKGGK